MSDVQLCSNVDYLTLGRTVVDMFGQELSKFFLEHSLVICKVI